MTNWLKLHTVMRSNQKIRRLPTDADRWHYVLALIAAKEQDPAGEWLDDGYFESAVGSETARRLPLFLEHELLTRDDDGTIRVPNWRKWQAAKDYVPAYQMAPDKLARTREQWRERQRRRRSRGADVTPDVTQMSRSVTPHREIERKRDVTRDEVVCSLCSQPLDGLPRTAVIDTDGGLASVHSGCLSASDQVVSVYDDNGLMVAT